MATMRNPKEEYQAVAFDQQSMTREPSYRYPGSVMHPYTEVVGKVGSTIRNRVCSQCVPYHCSIYSGRKASTVVEQARLLRYQTDKPKSQILVSCSLQFGRVS